MKVAFMMNSMMVVTKIKRTKSQLKNRMLIKNKIKERKSPPRLT